jgi:uncharacterized protein (TIGR03067 family)
VLTVPAGSDRTFYAKDFPNPVPRVVQEVDGDFTAQVKLTPPPPASPGQINASRGACLTAWKNEQDFCFLIHDRTRTNDMAGFTRFDGAPIGGYTSSTAPVPANQEHVYLKIERRGNTLSAFYSPNGANWLKSMKPLTVNWPRRVKVGVAACNRTTDVLRVQFEDFKVTQLAASAPAQNKNDKDLILGTWHPVSAEAFGQPIPPEVLDALKPSLTFTPEKVTWKVNPPAPIAKLIDALADKAPLTKEMATLLINGVEGVYHVDSSKTPKSIYSLEGDTLRLCVLHDPERVDERPTEFATKAGVLRGLVTLRRMK